MAFEGGDAAWPLATENSMSASLGAITLIAVAAFWVFCRIANQSEAKGFGRYNTSAFLLLTVAAVTGILAVTSKIDGPNVTAILTAIIGFAGGLFAGSKAG